MPSVTKTRTDLVNRAAKKAMLVASGQSLETDDQETIDEAVDGMLADLAARRVVYVANDDDIDISIFEWLADILAETVAPDFGKPRDLTKIAVAEQALYAINMSRPTYEVLEGEYF